MLNHSLIAAVALTLATLGLACEPTNQGYTPAQPIAYSHAVHAGKNQIPCQYCHFGAERGRYAGIPPTQICLNCHQRTLPVDPLAPPPATPPVVPVDPPEVLKLKAAIEAGEPIRWNKVHYLPDHAFFSHQPHVRAGVACQKCHGPVESMGRVQQWAPLTMGWCIECHREKGTEAPLRGTAQSEILLNCSTCHH